MSSVDYSVYLVTDSTMVPAGSTFLTQVENAINAGATMVQLREKSILTLDFIERASKVHEYTKRKGIPLIINDRVDVALAIDAEGVHVGQDDMPAKMVRQLIGPNKILGVTCSFPEEVEAVSRDNVADYVGLGTIYATNTKKVKVPEGCGPIGIRKMLQVLKRHNQQHLSPIRCVAIGGINHSNVSKVMFLCAVEGLAIDGVAIVSCIMANPDAGQATRDFASEVARANPWKALITLGLVSTTLKDQIDLVKHCKPLVHHITNNVVKNFSANITLAIGASPAMSELPDEYDEFASVPHVSLLLNAGTPTPEVLSVMKHAMKMYNNHNKHIVFDPVAAGASRSRLEASRTLLNCGQVSVIKGNLGEILAIRKLTSTYKETEGTDVLMRGVDSIASLEESQIIEIGREVSLDFKCIVVITGVKNYIVKGDKVEIVDGGHELMGSVTGTGCSLGSVIASFLGTVADSNYNIFEIVVCAVQLYNKSGRTAGQMSQSPGTFMINFIDQLYKDTH